MARPASALLVEPSRFAGLSRSRARFVLAGLAFFLALCLTALGSPDAQLAGASSAASGSARQTDLMLYDKIIADVRAGDNYYHAARDAMRAGDYPLRPFVTFRMPVLATVLAALPMWLWPYLLMALVVATASAWHNRLAGTLRGPLPLIAAGVLLVASMLSVFQQALIPFHEIWAGLLIALSLAMRRPGRWIEAVAFGLVAMLIRETAALYALIMLVFAWREGERREALGWAAALGLFALAVAAHALAVASVTAPTDPASPGWAGLLGFGFSIRALWLATGLQLFPLWIGALLVGLTLFGWLSWRNPLGLRMVAILAGYALAIALFARPDTFYWALLIAPVFLLGLLFVPNALRDLVTQALDKRRITVTRVSR